MFRNNSNERVLESSPYKNAKFREHARPRSRSRSRSGNRSFSQNNTSSVHSEHLWNALDQIELFPPICVEMLKYEQRNIAQYKKSINKQKNRVCSEIESITLQINHIIQDYKLSVLATLDRFYQSYINKYGHFKAQILQLNRFKNQIQGQFAIRQDNPTSLNKDKNLSNFRTIKLMEANQTQLKRYHIITYVAELQKQKITPLIQQAEYLMILSQYENGYFQPEEFKKNISNLRTGVRANFQQLLQQNYLYIRDPDNIVFKQQGRNPKGSHLHTEKQAEAPTLNQQHKLKRNLSEPNTQNIMHSQRNLQYIPSSNRLTSEPLMQTIREQFQKGPQIQRGFNINNTNRIPGYFPQCPPQKYHQSIPINQGSFIQNQSGIYDYKTQQISGEHQFQHPKQKVITNIYRQDPKDAKKNNENIQFHQQHYYYHPQVIVSPQRVSSDLIRISEQNIFSFKSKALDVILCCLYIDNNLIALGSKDGSLYFYDRNGKVIKSQQNVHKSPLCTLQLINDGQYLASGSDHPNPEIILWNLASYQFEPFCRLREHKGAVTAIQCLQDQEHMISGSYDKKLCVYSFHEQRLKYTLPSNKSSVTALTLNSTGSKLISCCLENNALNIWQVVRSLTQQGKNTVQTIFLQQVIESNSMICSVVASVVTPNLIYVGTKDGRLKIVDIEKGQAIKNMSCCNNALIQMLVIEQAEGLPVIICWPCKQKCYKIVDCESGKVTNVNTRGQLDFSCGVGPKASGTKDGSGFVVCSQSEDREVYWYKINRIF